MLGRAQRRHPGRGEPRPLEPRWRAIEDADVAHTLAQKPVGDGKAAHPGADDRDIGDIGAIGAPLRQRPIPRRVIEAGKIAREDWMAYLGWLRRVTQLPVESEVAVEAIDPAQGFLRLAFATPLRRGALTARKVVLATGRGGSGGCKWPDFVDPALRPDFAAHTEETIDFASLAGKRVAVLGGGASAFDNAATALEAGAAHVELFVRRPHLPQINKSKGVVYAGFQSGLVHLDDAARWRILVYMSDRGSPPPRETVQRVMAHGNVTVTTGAAWLAAEPHAGRARIRLAADAVPREVDFIILGTGFAVDLSRQPELNALLPQIALWRDRYAPPPELRRPALEMYPYLGAGFEFIERVPGTCPELRHLHAFNYGATASHGALAGDIPGLATGVARLVERIVVDLFRQDIAAHEAALHEFDEPELEGTSFFVPRPLP
ncbi:MAG: NAD(P)/FAD-dependent oxidoreductase [Alphaproteobacteria bacterium]|nr:NAD(P)/FAD-dependent oxidoreductase [Alphaproteobacteria bacterium]